MPPEVWWKAPAKINLYLKVLDQRPDGYHNISSLFQMVSLYDRLRFRSVPEGISLVTRGEIVSAGPDNLIYQAAEKLMRFCPRKNGVAIELDKQIPLGAGLGGGSSDAAATLLGLKRLWRLRIPNSDLMAMALELGSDVPFFMNGPTAFVQGRGEKIVPCRLSQPWWLLIVNPGLQVSTAWAYQKLAAERREAKTGLTNPSEGAKMSSLNYVPPIQPAGARKGRRIVVKEVLKLLENSLESVTGARHPVILDIKTRLLAAGSRGALMSGSGSTVFGLFSDRKAAKQAEDRLKGCPGFRVWIVKTLQRSPQRRRRQNRLQFCVCGVMKGGITMEVTEVRVHLVEKDKVKAYVSITLDDIFVIRDLKIIRGDKGLFVTMPRRRLPDGTFRDTAHSLNRELRNVIEEKVLKEYERKQAKEQGKQIRSGRQSTPHPAT